MEAASGFQPHAGLQQTLKQFHLSSRSSLGGPAAFSARWRGTAGSNGGVTGGGGGVGGGELTVSVPPPHTPPLGPGPLLIPPDRSTERCDTLLERETISCFVVGGEKRLCLPQILNSVLRDFSLQQINAVCDELHIYCSRCTAEQLEILKLMGILPFSAPSCGLITQTDAERLCSALVYGGAVPPPAVHKHNHAGKDATERDFSSSSSLRVYHECFGKCLGVFVPELYSSPGAPCIQCADCGLLFPPHRFVVHSHKRQENRTCHWGFDSSNWRAYILLDRGEEKEEEEEKMAELQKLLNELKAKFELGNKHKHSSFRAYSPVPVKRSRLDRSHSPSHDNNDPLDWLQSLTSSTNTDFKQLQFKQRPSAFRPWSAERAASGCKLQRSLTKPSECSVSPIAAHKREEQCSGSYPAQVRAPGSAHGSKPLQRWPSAEGETQTPAPAAAREHSDSDAEIEVENCDEAPVSRLVSNGVTSGKQSGAAFGREGGTGPALAPCSELEALRNTLYGDLSSREARERFLQEILHMRLKQEEKLAAALQAKRSLQQELEFVRVSKKGRLREAIEAKRSLRKEIERLRAECERKLQDANEACGRMKRELEREKLNHGCEKSCEAQTLSNKYSTQIEELLVKLQQAEAEREQLREELVKEREARKSLERVVLQLQRQLTTASRGQQQQQEEEEEDEEETGTDAVS